MTTLIERAGGPLSPLSAQPTVSNGRLGGWQGWLLGIHDLLITWQERARTRQSLRDMPDYLLRDIGLSPGEAGSEADKPFWCP